tara:strand:+ start:410 stop:721 length:312 start_codon:yes stop_codon:yes gene_type:complete
MKIINAKEFEKNPNLAKTVEPENDLKNILVEYVGETLSPDDQNVTVEMMVEVIAREFPEFMLAIAEENWVRGYQQALDDAEAGKMFLEQEDDKKRKSCKLCEK